MIIESHHQVQDDDDDETHTTNKAHNTISAATAPDIVA